jgi:ribonuclease J
MSAPRMSAESVCEPDSLEVRIHRGAHEIGGNCVELRHGQDTLILDIGKPLSTTWDAVVLLPAQVATH